MSSLEQLGSHSSFSYFDIKAGRYKEVILRRLWHLKSAKKTWKRDCSWDLS